MSIREKTFTKIRLVRDKTIIHDVIRILLYECWTISGRMKTNVEAMNMSLYRTLWTEYVSNKVIWKMMRKKTLLHRIRRRYLKLKGGLANMTLTGITEVSRDRKNHRGTYQTSPYKWIGARINWKGTWYIRNKKYIYELANFCYTVR